MPVSNARMTPPGPKIANAYRRAVRPENRFEDSELLVPHNRVGGHETNINGQQLLTPREDDSSGRTYLTRLPEGSPIVVVQLRWNARPIDDIRLDPDHVAGRRVCRSLGLRRV
jgi:hypothetical protein